MSLPISELGGKIIAGVAAACVMGGGGVVLTGAINDSARDQRIVALEDNQAATLTSLKDVTKEISDLNRKVERMLGRMEARDGK